MIRRLLPLAVLLGLVAGCSATSGREGEPDTRPTPPRTLTRPAPPQLSQRARPPAKTAEPKPKPEAKPKPARARPSRARVYVVVVNGDTNRRVRRARVRIGGRSDRSDVRGLAVLTLRRRAALPVTVSARGYTTRTVRLPFSKRRQGTIRLYRPAQQWAMYGVDPTRTQAHEEIHVRPPFRIVWSRGIGDLIEFPAVVSDGFAYIGNLRGTVRALSMRSGKVVWRRDVKGGKMAASPAVVGDSLVVHGMDGRVRVLDRRNGRLRWSFNVGSPIESSPVVRGGLDYFGAWDGNVYALDLRRRRIAWTFRSGYKITSSPSLAGERLFIGDYGGQLLALGPRTGRLQWVRSVNGRVYGTPAVAGGRVFVPSSTGGSLTAFTTTGRELWSRRTGGYVYSSPAVWAGRVLFGSYNGVFYGLSARTGAALWSIQTQGPISGAVAVVDGIAYAGSFSNVILGVRATTGRVLLRFPHGQYVPVSGNAGRLLLHGYSRIFAVEPRGGTQGSSAGPLLKRQTRRGRAVAAPGGARLRREVKGKQTAAPRRG